MSVETAGKVVLLAENSGLLAEVAKINPSDPDLKLLDIASLSLEEIPQSERFAVIVTEAAQLSEPIQQKLLCFYKNKQARSAEIILLFDRNKIDTLSPEIIECASVLISSDKKPEEILETIETSKNNHKQKMRLKSDLEDTIHAFSLLEQGQFKLKTLSEARAVSILLASLCPESTELTLGLSELLVNGIEHGNLEITFDEKGELLNTGTWHAEIDRRLKLKKYQSKEVIIEFKRFKGRVEFIISDEGAGFDTTPFLKPEEDTEFEREGLSCFHGRGIKLASQICFDELEYLGTGSTVKATLYLK
jgi:anti-sigma regulatory factor (Ser/Thr protein kinase)